MENKSDLMLEEANKLIFVKKYKEAESLIWRILRNQKSSNLLLAHLRLIELSVKLGTVDNLKKKYDEILAKDPENQIVQTAYVLAEQHVEDISPTEASAKFGELLKKNGGSAALYYGIGFCMEATRNLERALYNYEQCINQDPSFYPGYFGMSQVFYQMGDDAKGDYYFHIFEENAPYNVYGNFETHRGLSNEYLAEEQYQEAEMAIKSLSEWWVENKGTCPTEIQIYENFSLARIAEHAKDDQKAAHHRRRAISMGRQVLHDENSGNGILYFIAKALEEFAEFELALEYYQMVLSKETVTSDMVQKIGGQFLSLGEYELSLQLFEDAYKKQPDNPEIRFCLLVSKLRMHEVNVEEYLMQKERMKQLAASDSDRVELLSVLHNLVAKFDQDSEVQEHLGDLYVRLGNVERARKHFQKMFDIEPLSRATTLKYAGFEMQFGDPEFSHRLLSRFEGLEDLPVNERNEINWLKASFSLRRGEFADSRKHLSSALASDPWNVNYLVHDAVNLINLAKVSAELRIVDKPLEQLLAGDDESVNWDAFNKVTDRWESMHQYELAYVRDKLRLLYCERDDQALMSLVRRAGRYDAGRGTFDFLRLLNTNFDGPEIYWALGMLFKENWQLETACVWFDQILMLPEKNTLYRGRAFLELADCYVWREMNYEKAVEYIKVAMNLGERGDGRALTIMAHAFLKLGQVKQAELYLEDAEFGKDHEAAYLRGLVHYRNGLQQEANTVWKPLLTVRSDNLRFHNIKQEILKYYFEKAPYLEVN